MYLIKDSRIYDGRGGEPYSADVLIRGEKIEKIGKNIPAGNARVIDGRGMVLTPGFIDIHRHCDLAALYGDDFGRLELAQGITGMVVGNCGLGIVPNTQEYVREICRYVEPCLGKVTEEQLKELPDTCQKYLEMLQRCRRPVHVGTLIPMGTLKAAIRGYGNGRMSAEEKKRACGYIRRSLEEGALGISMGIMYQPECYSSREEMTEMLSAASVYRRPVSCHIRGEGDLLVESVKEILEICREAEVPLNISHLKSVGRKNWNTAIYRAVEQVEKARGNGQDVTVDVYPYSGGASTLLSLVPPEIVEKGYGRWTELLAGRSGKDALKAALEKKHEGWDNMVSAIGWERILLSDAQSPEFSGIVGEDFRTGAEKLGYEDPSELLADLLCRENGSAGIVVLSMSQEDVDAVMRLPYSMVISDALYGNQKKPHPRLYGAFPRVIREYVLERHVLTMEEAVRKMTSLPARRMKLEGRGEIREGFYADLNLFDPKAVKDTADYQNPRRLSSGIRFTWVDGRIATEEGVLSGYADAQILSLK